MDETERAERVAEQADHLVEAYAIFDALIEITAERYAGKILSARDVVLVHNDIDYSWKSICKCSHKDIFLGIVLGWLSHVCNFSIDEKLMKDQHDIAEFVYKSAAEYLDKLDGNES